MSLVQEPCRIFSLWVKPDISFQLEPRGKLEECRKMAAMFIQEVLNRQQKQSLDAPSQGTTDGSIPGLLPGAVDSAWRGQADEMCLPLFCLVSLRAEGAREGCCGLLQAQSLDCSSSRLFK